MNTIGIIAAMDVEIEALKERVGEFETFELASHTYYRGNIGNKTVIFSNSGIGKVNAAITTQVLIDNFKPDAIINVGIAGGLDKSLKHMSIVVADKLTYHDFDHYLMGKYYPFTTEFYCDKNLIEKSKDIMKDEDIHVGTVITGDVFVDSTELQRQLHDKYNALCVEMEGASIAHTSFANKIPFVVVRSISDFADDDSETDYENFEKIAADKAGNFLVDLINII